MPQDQPIVYPADNSIDARGRPGSNDPAQPPPAHRPPSMLRLGFTQFPPRIMQHPTPRILALLLVVAVGSAAQAKDLHVDNVAGDDLWNGQAAVRADNDGPTKTIAKALRMAGPGDRIVLTKTAAPYQESVSLVGSRHSGTPTRPFVFEGNGAILSGLAPVPDEVWEPFQGDIFRFRTQRPHDQQVYWQGKPLRRVLDPAQIERRELAPLEWLIDEGHVFFRVEPERLPSSYQLEA